MKCVQQVFNEDCIQLKSVATSQVSVPDTEFYDSIGEVVKTGWDDEDQDDSEFADIQVPQGQILASMRGGNHVTVLKEDEVVVVDRCISHGALVRWKSLPLTSQSGTVVKSHLRLDLQHLQSGKIIKDIESALVSYFFDLDRGFTVSDGDWVGEIEDIFDTITIEFPDGQIWETDIECLESLDRLDIKLKNDRLFPGERVKLIHEYVTGKWDKGTAPYPSKDAIGLVKAVKIDALRVNWTLFNSLKNGKDAVMPKSYQRPPAVKPHHSQFQHITHQIGDVVKFKSPSHHMLYTNEPIDETTAPANLSFKVLKTKTTLDIQWQDGTVINNINSIDIIPCIHLDDQDLWPTDYVILKNTESKTEKTGVVSSVNSRERIARIRWFDENLERVNSKEEEYSLYEISVHPDMQYRIGEKVIVTDDFNFSKLTGITQDDWFGEVMSIGVNGLVNVKFFLTGHDAWISPKNLLIVPSQNDDGYDDGESEDECESGSEFESSIASSDRSSLDRKKASAPAAIIKMERIGENGEWVTDTEESEWETDEEESSGADLDVEMETEDVDTIEEYEKLPQDGTNSWELFKSLDAAPLDHHFSKTEAQNYPKSFYQRIRKEYDILSKSLPKGILVRVFEDRMELIRVLMVGPEGTPYDKGLYMFDLRLRSDYPQSPPDVYFHSWTYGLGRLNPNLYEDGKVCLSLLGTWHGKGSETWSSQSNILQVLVSIQGLVLNRSPYYNEAGYERQIGTEEGAVNCALYTERTYLLALRSVIHILSHPPDPFKSEVLFHFYTQGKLDKIVNTAIKILEESENAKESKLTPIEESVWSLSVDEIDFPLRRVSGGCMKLLKNYIEILREKRKEK